MDAPPESWVCSPDLLPYATDVQSDTVTFIRLNRAAYSQASFLDSRILTPHTAARTLSWQQVAASIEMASLPERCHFIFHIGHVGSTLLSRLVGGHPDAFALREPKILRDLAAVHEERGGVPRAWSDALFDVRLGDCVKLLSRTYELRQIPVVKATSFVSELAAKLLARAAAPKAVMMYVSPASYFATILGGPNSRQEARVLTPSRLRRLHGRIGRDVWGPKTLSEGEALAVSWACEMSALEHAARAAGTRILRIDFDQFLADPSAHLFAAMHHFGIDATADEVRAILDGPDLRRYSKAPEHAYDASLRQEVLNEARRTHGVEIRRGLRWLELAASETAVVRDALVFAHPAR